MASVLPDSISIIDGQYMYAGRAAAYLIQDGEEAAFVDNVTRFSVPYLLDALDARNLRPEQVRYLIVTHIHLDHSGGTAELAKACPNATVICHPRAKRHIIDPTRLVASAKSVYEADEFEKLYGEIGPVDEKRVESLEDGGTLPLGSRTLTFLDSPGHAPHHFVIQDSATNSMFAGDAFGLRYAQLQSGTRPYFNYVCAPPQFDPEAAKRSIQRIVETGVDRIFVTHFGQCDEVVDGASQLLEALDHYDRLVNDAAATELQDASLLEYCSEGALDIMRRELRACDLDPEDGKTWKWATSEHKVSSQGLAVLANLRRENSAQQQP